MFFDTPLASLCFNFPISPHMSPDKRSSSLYFPLPEKPPQNIFLLLFYAVSVSHSGRFEGGKLGIYNQVQTDPDLI